MTRPVILHGSLKARFGGPFHLEVASSGEAVRALSCMLPGFERAILDGSWHVLAGGEDLDEERVPLLLAPGAAIEIMPAVEGAERGGLMKILIGVALIGVSFLLPGSILGVTAAGSATGVGAMTGASAGAAIAAPTGLGAIFTASRVFFTGLGMVLQGASSLMSVQPKAPEAPDERASFRLGGPITVSKQGGAVPLVFGECYTGGVVISAGITAEQLL